MRLTAEEEEKVIRILSKSFDRNPTIDYVVKKDGNRSRRIENLSRYALRVALRRDGFYWSRDKHGVALCYRSSMEREGIADYIDQLKLIQGTIGWTRLPAVFRREAQIKERRPKNFEYLYFWFFGVDPDFVGNGEGHELKEKIFKLSDETGLPIYSETSIRKNKLVYERYGFEVYDEWEVEEGYKIWFMRRFPASKK